jgi:hypothetical protein
LFADYKNEEYADGNACNTVCCRGDLLSKPEAGGCFDAKVTNYTMALSQITYGISGPTTEVYTHTVQFCWFVLTETAWYS